MKKPTLAMTILMMSLTWLTPLNADERPIRMSVQCSTGSIKITAQRAGIEQFSIDDIDAAIRACGYTRL